MNMPRANWATILGSTALSTVLFAGYIMPAYADNTAVIEEITVTAQKRQESGQKVPIAIQVIKGSDLAALGVNTTNDLPLAVPGFQISSSAGNQLYYLRGVGSQQVGTSASSEVSTFVDGVYMPFQTSALQGFNNISTIEVDKGPQGTLFGRNSTGGIIQIKTKDPTHEPAADLSLSYGNYNTVSGSGYITGGITSKLAADLAVNIRHQQDGYGTNIATGKDVFKDQMYSVRSKWLLDVSDDTKIVIIGDYSRVLGDNGSAMRPAKNIPSLFNEVTNGTLIYPGFYDTQQDTRSNHTATEYGFSAKLQTNFDWAQFSSITAWRKSNVNMYVDFDAAPQTFVPVYVHERQKMASQEFQLSSPSASSLTWVVGAFLLRQTGHTNPFEFGSPFASIVFGAPAGETYSLHSNVETTSLAGYGQGTATILPDTHLTLGIRYTYDRKKINGYALSGSDVVPGTTGDQAVTYKKPTFRVSLDHDLTSDVKVYASFNRGFQSGTFNSNSAGGYTQAANPPLQPENIDAYEVGLKSEWFDHRLRANISAFYYDYSNLQQQSYVGNVLVTGNAGSAHIKGIDLELLARPTQALTLGISGEVLNAKYADYHNAPLYSYAPGGALITNPGNATGNYLTYAPKLTGTIFANYVFETSIGRFTTSGSLSYNDGYYADPGNLYKEPKYFVTNLSESLAFNERFEVTAWVKNLNNRKYDSSVAAVTPIGFVGNTPGAPREFGVTVKVHM